MLLQKELLREEDVARKGYERRKRLQDILLAVLLLALLWPFMLLVAVIILIDSPGASPFFSQTRVGKNGREFTFYKFRSMIPNAEDRLVELLPQNEMDGPAFKMKKDPRVTRFGRFIRMTSIDELPQLWNVLLGQMSIVGPRPALPREVAQYGEREKQRLLVRPGMTGLWQIQPNRNDLSFETWLELDLAYIRRRSTRLDWWIIFKTFGAVFKMRGV